MFAEKTTSIGFDIYSRVSEPAQRVMIVTSPSAFVIRMYLPEGLPEGIRIVEKSNWVGQAVVCPQSRFAVVRQRPEAGRAGVLRPPWTRGQDDLPMAYIGEADPLFERLVQHYRTKDWWTSVVFFASKDSKDRQLNKVHVQYLEAKLVQLARAAAGPWGPQSRCSVLTRAPAVKMPSN